MKKQINSNTIRESQEFYNAVAERIYNLDTKVYAATESKLGRAFTGQREQCIKELVDLLCSESQSYKLRSEMAIISNMSRTIKSRDPLVYREIMLEYNDILEDVKNHQSSFISIDILNNEIAELNASNTRNIKNAENNHTIICISRSHGSAGADIAFALADNLRINYYDMDVFRAELDYSDEKKDEAWMKEHNHHFSRYHGLSKKDADFFNLSSMLLEKAKSEDFVVVGRCADAILDSHGIPHTSIFITAPEEARAKRVMEIHNVPTYRKALKSVKKSDKYHKAYYYRYTSRMWGYAGNYNLCLNSMSYGIDEAVEVIKRIIMKEGRAPVGATSVTGNKMETNP